MSFSFCFRTMKVLSGSSNRHFGGIPTRLHSSRCISSIVCGILLLLWSAPLFPLGLEALLYMGAVLRSRLVRGFLEYILTLSLSFTRLPQLDLLCLLRYAGIQERRLVVKYVRTDTWKYISASGP